MSSCGIQTGRRRHAAFNSRRGRALRSPHSRAQPVCPPRSARPGCSCRMSDCATSCSPRCAHRVLMRRPPAHSRRPPRRRTVRRAGRSRHCLMAVRRPSASALSTARGMSSGSPAAPASGRSLPSSLRRRGRCWSKPARASGPSRPTGRPMRSPLASLTARTPSSGSPSTARLFPPDRRRSTPSRRSARTASNAAAGNMARTTTSRCCGSSARSRMPLPARS